MSESRTKSSIPKVVLAYGLEPGDTMLTIHGDRIENSVVLDRLSIALREPAGGYRLIFADPILHEESSLWLSDGAAAALSGFLERWPAALQAKDPPHE